MTTFLILAALLAVGLLFWAFNNPEQVQKRKLAAIRAKTSATAAELIANGQQWVILDTETTGIDDGAVIIEIAAIDSHGDTIINTRVKLQPRKRITDRATAVHGITRDMLADAPSWTEVRASLDRALAGRTCIAYNASFDARLIEQTDAAHRVTGNKLQWLDAMALYNTYVAEWDDRRQQLKYQKLPGATHGALSDCRAVLRLLHQMAKTSVP